MAESKAGENHRVTALDKTVALINQRCDIQDKLLGEIKSSIDKVCDKHDIIADQVIVNTTNIENLKSQSRLWNAVNSAGVLIAGVFGANR